MASKFQRSFTPIPDLTGSKRLLVFLLFLSLGGGFFAQAQVICQDEMLINPYYDCGTSFAPVCACDGNTYRNQCAATYHGGIQGNRWVSGPCQEFYFFIYPTLCLNGNLKFLLQSKNRGRVNVYLINGFGSIESQLQIEIGTSANTEFDLDVTAFPSGIYFMVVQGASHTQIERFVVLPS